MVDFLMMTSSNGNIFRVTGHLCGNSPVTGEFPAHKGQWHRALMFSLICAWMNGWVNNREAVDFRRHRAHYDVTVMCTPICIVWCVFPWRRPNCYAMVVIIGLYNSLLPERTDDEWGRDFHTIYSISIVVLSLLTEQSKSQLMFLFRNDPMFFLTNCAIFK